MPDWLRSLLKSIPIFIVLCLFYAWFYFFTAQPRIDNVQMWGRIPADEINKDRSVSQSFVSHGDKLTGIGVRFATYQRQNKGTLNFALYRLGASDGKREKEKVFWRTLPTSVLEDGALQTFWFNPIGESKNDKYLFTLSSPDSYSGNAVTVFLSDGKLYQEGTAYENQRPIKADLNFVTYVYQTNQQMMNNFFTGKSPFVSPGNKVTFYLTLFPLLFLISYFLVNVWEFMKSTESTGIILKGENVT